MRYELTDAEIDRLGVAWCGIGPTPRQRDAAREWFASLPVVSREAAEKASGPLSEDEKDRLWEDFCKRGELGRRSFCGHVDRLLVRRRDMLGDAPDEPPKPEVKAGESALRDALKSLLDADNQLSQWAASVKWNPAERNTREWLDGLRERIVAAQLEAEKAAKLLGGEATIPSLPPCYEVGKASFKPGNPELAPTEAVPPPRDPVNHPAHYHGDGMEAIDVIKAFGLGFLDGNVVKHVIRRRNKNGVEDLKQARWYLDRLIVETEAKP